MAMAVPSESTRLPHSGPAVPSVKIDSSMADTPRATFYRLTFALAAVYNVAFGLWAGLWPHAFFELFRLEPPRYPSLWACLGMVVGVYGLGYAYAARRLDAARPFIAIGLLGKVLGPAGWVVAVTRGELPLRTFPLIALNDVIWWVPFALFLVSGRVGRHD